MAFFVTRMDTPVAVDEPAQDINTLLTCFVADIFF